MSNFFEKLKKGMGTEEEPVQEGEMETETETEEETETETETGTKTEREEIETEKEIEKPAPRKIRKPRKDKKQIPEFKVETLPSQSKTSLAIQTETTEKEIKEPEKKKERKWLSFGEEEGQLTIDVYQTENDLVIQTAVAGVRPEDLDISIERDVVTIRGGREKQYQEKGDYFIQECFWGAFSRQVILPAEVNPGQAKASFKEGILTIRMPKIQREKKMKINVSA
jgi:HSP20 family protein